MFAPDERVTHYTGTASGRVLLVVTEPPPPIEERVAAWAIGWDEVTPSFHSRPAILVAWDNHRPQWVRPNYLTAENLCGE